MILKKYLVKNSLKDISWACAIVLKSCADIR